MNTYSFCTEATGSCNTTELKSKRFNAVDVKVTESWPGHTVGWHDISEALIVPNVLFDQLKGELELVESVSA